MDSVTQMSDQVFRDYAAVEAVKAFIGRFPLPAIPGQEHDLGRQNLVRQICHDSFEIANQMREERRMHPW